MSEEVQEEVPKVKIEYEPLPPFNTDVIKAWIVKALAVYPIAVASKEFLKVFPLFVDDIYGPYKHIEGITRERFRLCKADKRLEISNQIEERAKVLKEQDFSIFAYACPINRIVRYVELIQGVNLNKDVTITQEMHLIEKIKREIEEIGGTPQSTRQIINTALENAEIPEEHTFGIGSSNGSSNTKQEV